MAPGLPSVDDLGLARPPGGMFRSSPCIFRSSTLHSQSLCPQEQYCFLSLQETGPSRKENGSLAAKETILLWHSPGERNSRSPATQRANPLLVFTQVSSSPHGFYHTHAAFPLPELPLALLSLGGRLRGPVLIRGPNYILPDVLQSFGDGRKKKTNPSKVKPSRNSKFHP